MINCGLQTLNLSKCINECVVSVLMSASREKKLYKIEEGNGVSCLTILFILNPFTSCSDDDDVLKYFSHLMENDARENVR